MYTDFYRLVAEPFQLTPDHRFFFGSSVHSQALAHLTYGLQQGEGFIVITGDIGAGKTTLVSQLLATLDAKKYITAKVVTTQLDADDLLRTVVAAFGVRADFTSKADMLRQMEQFFTVNYRAGRRCLLLIDEAQNLTPQALEELRMLSNFQVGEKTPLQSFILGQPQFRAVLNSPELEQLRQRIIANYHLGPLDLDETRRYIEHRLITAGWQHDPEISAEAYAAVHRHTDGVPRRINGLCNRLFLYGFLEEKHALDETDVDRVARDLNREENPDIRGKDLVGLPRHQRSPVLHLDQDRLEEMARRLEAVETREPAAAPVDTRATEDLRRRIDMMEEYIRLRAVADRTYDDIMRRMSVLEEARASAPPPAPPVDLGPLLDRLAALENRPAETAPAPFVDLSPLEQRLAALESRPVESAPTPFVDLSPLEQRLSALESRPVESAPAPFVDLSPLEQRLAALENRPVETAPQIDWSRIEGLERELAALRNAPPPFVDLSPLHQRIAALENRPVESPPAIDLTPLEQRLAALESAPAPVADLSALEQRLAALEGRGTEIPRLDALEQRVAGMASPPDMSWVDRRLSALENRPAGTGGPPIDTGRIEALELRIAAQPIDLVDRIGRLEAALRADETSLGGRIEALERQEAGAPFTYVATLEERLNALESAPAGNGTEGAAVEALALRLSQIESAQRQLPPASLVEDVKGRLTALEQSVAAMPSTAASMPETRDLDPRLDSLERKLAAQEAMLRRAIGLAAALLERGRPQEAQDAG